MRAESGGVAIVTMLNILEAYDLAGMGHMSAEYVHHVAEAMRYRRPSAWHSAMGTGAVA